MKPWMWIIGAAILSFNAIISTAQPCGFSAANSAGNMGYTGGGSFSGSCTLSVTGVTIRGPVTWSSDLLQILGTSGNITVVSGGSLTITGGGIETIDGNNGRIIVQQGGTLTIGSLATLTSYGVLEIDGLMQIDGTCTLTGGRLDILNDGQVYVGSTGLLDVMGTGDNEVRGLLSIAGQLQTNGDIDVIGTLEVLDGGEIQDKAGGGTITIEAYNGGNVTVDEGGSVHIDGSLLNTDVDGNGCGTGVACPSGGTFDINGMLYVGVNATISNTTPNSSFTSSAHTGDITIGGTFQDNECASYGAGDYHFCECNEEIGASCSAALPIEIISFSGQQIGNSVMLHWTTASETTNDFFSVERLITDADSFIEVGKINGAGTSYTEINYEALDRAPEPGRNYYRLKQTDFDKTITYSSLIAVEYEALEMELGVYPNPCSAGSIVISSKRLAPNQTIHIALKNNQGVNFFSGIWQADAAGNLQKELDVSSLAEGMYIVQAGPLTSKVIISK